LQHYFGGNSTKYYGRDGDLHNLFKILWAGEHVAGVFIGLHLVGYGIVAGRLGGREDGASERVRVRRGLL
jgi:hypothetical protein